MSRCLPQGSQHAEDAPAAAGDKVAELPAAGTAVFRCWAQSRDRGLVPAHGRGRLSLESARVP